jgi:hypothetical protein
MLGKLAENVYLIQKMEAPGEQFALKIVESEGWVLVNEYANLSKFDKH